MITIPIFFGFELVVLVFAYVLFKGGRQIWDMWQPREDLSHYRLPCPKCGTLNEHEPLDPIYACAVCFGVFDIFGRPVKGPPLTDAEVRAAIDAENAVIYPALGIR